MSGTNVLVTCASWEDRFRGGLEVDLDQRTPQTLLMFYYDKFAAWSEPNREAAREACRTRGVECVERELKADDPAGNWKQLRQEVDQRVPRGSRVHIDITTMPRELIWATLWMLETAGAGVGYTYHRPETYDSHWLSRDPGRPRFVYKMSGVTNLGRRTALVVLTGYDTQRTSQLIRFYEPMVTLVGLQAGDLNPGNAARMEEQRKLFSGYPAAAVFDVDAFAEDHGFSTMLGHVRPYIDSHNVIMSSLGPKLSAISIYRVHREHPEVAITYAPSCEFNQHYSRGLGGSFSGQI